VQRRRVTPFDLFLIMLVGPMIFLQIWAVTDMASLIWHMINHQWHIWHPNGFFGS
jgi:hypothetical protein